MKAVVLHEYGGPDKLKWEEFPQPQPRGNELLIAVSVASVNPVDWKMRKDGAGGKFPVEFPAVLGRDVAGVVSADGNGFAAGDRVLALGHCTYSQLCTVVAADVAHVPDGMEMTAAAAVPLAALTGDQLIREACHLAAGQTVMITGALGSVGRCAVFAAAELGATVIAGVRKSQLKQAAALDGVARAVALDDAESLAEIGWLDAIAGVIAGDFNARLMPRVKPGGVFGSLFGMPAGAELHTQIEFKPMTAHPDAARTRHYAEAVHAGRLELPIADVLPMRDAGEAQRRGEKGGIDGKLVLVVSED